LVKESLAGKPVIQLGTINTNQSRTIQRLIEEAGGEYFEAPVLGNPKDAEAGTLLVMVGGTQEQYDRFLPLFQVIGSDVYFVGEVGKAAALKLALNQMIGALVTAFSLSLGIVLRENLQVEHFMEILRQSSYYAPTFDKKLNWMLQRNFAATNFPIRLMLKDVNLILDQASGLGLRTEGLKGVHQILKAAFDAGWGEDDYSAVYNAVNPPD
jgi:3-hydroxyisobutyrate dehydrogenase